MKEVHQDTNFAAAVSEPEPEGNIEETVSFAPDQRIGSINDEFEETDRNGSDTECAQPVCELEHPTEEEDSTSPPALDSHSEPDYIDTEEADTGYGDNDLEWTEEEEEEEEPVLVYDVPRPALTIDEAATILGKSVRAVERGISGKWGNRLPEGWKARKMKIDGQDEWRIIPPPSFRVRHSRTGTPRTEVMTNKTIEKPAAVQSSREDVAARERDNSGESLFGFSLNSLIQTAGKRAKTELARAAEYAMETTMEHPTIVIDRSDEVERLLRELADTRKELSDERRMHLEDLRMMAEMQGSMRLLEMKSSQTSTLKEELVEATRALQEHRRQYQEFLALPWWKRLFRKTP